MSVVKMKLRAGSREIEVEGSRADVDALLERWWTNDGSEEESGSTLTPPPLRTRKVASKRRGSGEKTEAKPSSFDPQVLVNKMREDEDYELFEEKVLHKKELLAKVKLVCWYSRDEHTTGEIAKVLLALGVRVEQSSVSHAINRARADFIQDAARTKGAIVRYKLAGKSIKEFASWLHS